MLYLWSILRIAAMEMKYLIRSIFVAISDPWDINALSCTVSGRAVSVEVRGVIDRGEN